MVQSECIFCYLVLILCQVWFFSNFEAAWEVRPISASSSIVPNPAHSVRDAAAHITAQQRRRWCMYRSRRARFGRHYHHPTIIVNKSSAGDAGGDWQKINTDTSSVTVGNLPLYAAVCSRFSRLQTLPITGRQRTRYYLSTVRSVSAVT